MDRYGTEHFAGAPLLLIDFDSIDDWHGSFSAALASHLPVDLSERLRQSQPRYVEDARDLLLKLADRERIIDAVLAWLARGTVLAYHGTRLTLAEQGSVKTKGLLPLKAEARRARLERALSSHPRWTEVSQRLDYELTKHGSGRARKREGQVHLTLSRAGLTQQFNHYLTHGAEIDQHVAKALLGEEGGRLLARDGLPTMVTVAVPGAIALEAAHPYFTIAMMRETNELPNIMKEFVSIWAFQQANPACQSSRLEVDCGMVFRAVVPAGWIKSIETLSD
jgi:hypothetical protein